MQQETHQKRSWLKTSAKVLMWTLLVLIVSLGIAYWTAPSWIPGQVQKFLPDTVQIKDLTLQRPGLTSTQIDGLIINLGQEEPYKVRLKNVTLGYSLWRQKLTSINAESAHLTWPQKKQDTSSSPSLELPPLPVLPVTDIKLDKLTIEGLTLQNIVANNIVLEEYTEGLRLNTRIQFLHKNFNVEADAQRNNSNLSKIKADITQNDNRLAVTAVPITSKHWAISSEGQLKLQELYPQPGIEPVSFIINGSVKNQEETIQLALEESSKIESSIDIKALQLDQMLKEFLTQYLIQANLDELESNYHLTLKPTHKVLLNYQIDESKIALEQGYLAIKLENPSIKTDVQLQQLQLNLNEALSAENQKATFITQASIKDLKGRLDSPEHTTTTTSLALDVKATVKLLSDALNLENSSGLINLGSIDYTGNNSTATANSSQWRFQGNSKVNLVDPQATTHQWEIASSKPVNANLKLSDEQFSAQNINATLQFSKDKQAPQGKLFGKYELSNITLEQQPLKLGGVKGELDYPLSKTPKGNLSFNNVHYKGKQIGVTNIAGQLDWIKQSSAFVASGNLKHEASKVPFSYSFNLENSKHNLKIAQSSLPVSTVTSWLNILKDYPELRFSSGQLEIDSLDGDPIGLLFDGKVRLDNFNLNYDEFYIKNWIIEDSLNSQSKLGGTLQSHIDSIELATDIAITNITFKMPHTINSLVISDLKGKLLSGTIEIPKLAINEEGIPPFTAYLKAIDINALLTALNSEKLQLTGRFDFTLPLILSSQGQQIQNGTFKALGEGVIKLKSDKSEEANIAFQALENFHYKEFSGSLNYNLDGDYVVELHVLGSNPELYNGFPIKLDLTLRGQLPELLYSMIVSGDMTKPILDELEQKQILNIQP